MPILHLSGLALLIFWRRHATPSNGEHYILPGDDSVIYTYNIQDPSATSRNIALRINRIFTENPELLLKRAAQLLQQIISLYIWSNTLIRDRETFNFYTGF